MSSKPIDTNTPAEGKIWNAAFINLFIISLMSNIGFNMSNSLLSVYADHLGASTVAVGVVFSTFAVSALAFRFIAAPIMDTYNRKHVMIIASLILAVAFFGYSLSKSVSALLVFRLIQGCGVAGNACSFVMVADVLPRDKYGAGIGYFSLAMVISSAIGPSLGLWLVEAVGYSWTFAIFATLMLLGALMASMLKISYKRTKKLELKFNNLIAKEVLLPSGLLFLLITGLHFGNSFLILYAGTRGITTSIGLYYTISSITSLVMRPVLGRLTDKKGIVPIVIPALCCHIIACFMISFSTTLWHFLLAAVVNAMGSSVCQPAFQTVSMKKVPSGRRGAASSTNMIGLDLAALVGPFLGGMTAEKFGYSVMYRFQALPYFLCMVILFVSRKWIYKAEAEFEQVKTESA